MFYKKDCFKYIKLNIIGFMDGIFYVRKSVVLEILFSFFVNITLNIFHLISEFSKRKNRFFNQIIISVLIDLN